MVVFLTGHATALEMPHEYNRAVLGFLFKAFQSIAREERPLAQAVVARR